MSLDIDHEILAEEFDEEFERGVDVEVMNQIRIECGEEPLDKEEDHVNGLDS